jgi:glycosyltransferase involved in cell wall biosynthesis
MQHPNKPIRVGVDIRDLRVAKTGQKTVWEELCKQFAHYKDSSIEFIFIDDRGSIPTGKKKWQIIWGHIRYQYWKQVLLPWKAWRNGCDIVFCGDYFVPLIQPGFRTIEIFHDAFFFEYPEHYHTLWRKLFHWIAMPGARKCSSIMVTTQYARQQVHQHTGIPLDKLIPIQPGPKTFPAVAATVPAAIQDIIATPYILHVGVMEKRKNLPMLIKAFDLYCAQGDQQRRLILAGKGNGKKDSDDTLAIEAAIAQSPYKDRIICTGYLSDALVALLYQQADLYVFPSMNEGFGIPVLEAFHFQVPVLVANNTCLPEVGGDAVLAFDPTKPAALAALMNKVLQDKSLQQEMIKKGSERLKDFSWEVAAQKLIALFKQTVSHG